MSKQAPSAYSFIAALKQEEAEYIHSLIADMHYSVRSDQEKEPDVVFRVKNGGRDMTHWEVYLDAIAEVMLLVDARIGDLHEKGKE